MPLSATSTLGPWTLLYLSVIVAYFIGVALRRVIQYLRPGLVIGVGAFAEARARAALADSDVRIGRILHPSPASPVANRGWSQQAEKQLLRLGVKLADIMPP